MKIAFLSFYSGFVERGAEVFVSELAKRLRKNHQVVIFHSDSVPTSWSRQNFFSYFYLDKQSLKIAWFTLKRLFKITTKNFDFIIAVNGGWQTLFCKLYSLFFGTKLIISGQAGRGRDDKFNLWCCPDAFVALSEAGYRWAKEINPIIKIVKIPNGVDLEKFSPQIKKATLDLAKPIILCVAALEKYKRVELSLRAIARLKKGSLLLIGSGQQNQLDYFDNLGKQLLGVRRYCRLTVRHEEIPSYYVAADLFTMVSENCEAFGTVYLEAMACNLPVVAPDDDLRREIIGPAGILVKNPEDIQRYAHGLALALKTDFKNLPRKQAEKFSWDKIAADYERLLRKLKS